MSDERRALLRRVPIFSGLTDAELAALPTTTRALRAGETLFTRGDAAASAFVVAAGRVKVTAPVAGGGELVIQLLGAGKVLGELSLFERRRAEAARPPRRSATVTAVGPARLLAIDGRDFLAAVRRHPDVALTLMAELAGRVRELSAALEESVSLGLAARLARKLLALSGTFGRPVPGGVRIGLALPQRELGAMIGFSRESVNKQMRAWSRAGIVRMTDGVITVLDVDALAAAARAAV